MGTNDLYKELGAEHVPRPRRRSRPPAAGLLAARAAGMVVLDGVYNDVKDADGFLAEAARAASWASTARR